MSPHRAMYGAAVLILLPALCSPAAVVAAQSSSPLGTAVDVFTDGLCGGLGVQGRWIGSDIFGSDLSNASVALEHDLHISAGGEQVYLFSLSSDANVRLEAAGAGTADPYLTLYNAVGAQLVSDDDGGGGYAARIHASLSPGAYCLLTRSYDDSQSMAVTVRLGEARHESLSVGGDGSGAGAMACQAAGLAPLAGEPLDAAALQAGIEGVASVARTPAWRFTLAEDLPLTIIARSAAGDPVLRLRDASGALLDENDDADGTDSRIDRISALAAGDYCLELEDLNGPDNAIRVGLSLFDAAADRKRRIGAAEFSPLADDDVSVQPLGEIGKMRMVDVPATATASWYSLEVPEDGVLWIETVSKDIDPAVVLFDRVGRRLDENDDGPDGRDSQLVQRVPAGSYLLAVRLVTQAGPGNVRVLLERLVPAR